MPTANLAAYKFLKTRRSRPAKTLTTPVPDRATLEELLVVAARTPDHGKLEPWRFIVLEKPALQRLAEAVGPRGEDLGVEPEKVNEKASFIDDLGADSLDTVELVMAFEEEFGCEIPDDAAETILTVGDAVKFLQQQQS